MMQPYDPYVCQDKVLLTPVLAVSAADARAYARKIEIIADQVDQNARAEAERLRFRCECGSSCKCTKFTIEKPGTCGLPPDALRLRGFIEDDSKMSVVLGPASIDRLIAVLQEIRGCAA